MKSEDRELVAQLLEDRWIRDCEGWTRRNFLKIGLTGLLALSLPDILQLRALANPPLDRKRSVILLFMNGGPSHVDTFDPKPEAGPEIAGPLKAIPTNVDGVRICEALPRLGQRMDKAVLIRSMKSGENSHERAQHLLQTGYLPLASQEYPSYGSVIAKERGDDSVLPGYVAIGGSSNGIGAGFLGQQFDPFEAGNPMQQNYRLPDGTPPVNLSPERISRRRAFLNALDTARRDNERMKAMDTFYNKAFAIMESKEAREAFEISREPQALREQYGMNLFGQSCLLAVRLVEAGVDFVTVTLGGWDTHENNFVQLPQRLLPMMDQAMAALFDDLQRRGLFDSTLVVWTGEFGRTPKINKNARPGRDHWGNAWTVLMAGAGIQGGRVIGSTDERGMEVAEDPVTPENLAATIYEKAGIDYKKYYETPSGRPIRLATSDPIPGL
ncbi:MAG: hypothetical protein KatS3mg015_1964 [Fimbriimonadales bacterium]|nr:MAG: hypothetical protein KatS3mg015_1964 [Fimbriimonadales bacterium]